MAHLERLEIARMGAECGGDSRPTPGGAGIAQVGGLLGVRGGILVVCRRGVLAEVSEPPFLPIRPFENAYKADYAHRIDKVEIAARRAQIIVLRKIRVQDDQAGRRALNGGADRV